jgi:uncharacterized membrane protein YeaQ/YmgE (transglycosylase-associated protein family)
MTTLADPVVTFLILLLIGIVAGLLAQRFLRSSWLTAQFAGRRASVTHALVGIAGSFIGYHLGVLLNLRSQGAIALFLAAILGAALVLWVWKTIRL